MANMFEMATLEVVQLANGRFSVLPIGAPALEDDSGEFETRAEAQDWLFQRQQEKAARDSDDGVIMPGGGQGLR